jgi:hypothetical protein
MEMDAAVTAAATPNGSLVRQPASRMLVAALTASSAETVTIDEIVKALRRRAFGLVLMLVALINCVPLPPGISSLAGVPVFLIGIQMLIGRRIPWLPLWLRRRSFNRAALLQALHRIEPYLARVERVSRPRLPRVVGIVNPHLVGAMVVLLSLFIMTPLVFTNIPPAMASVFLAVALTEEDGLLLLIGLVLAIAAMALSATLAAGTIAIVLVGLGRLLGW